MEQSLCPFQRSHARWGRGRCMPEDSLMLQEQADSRGICLAVLSQLFVSSCCQHCRGGWDKDGLNGRLQHPQV